MCFWSFFTSRKKEVKNKNDLGLEFKKELILKKQNQLFWIMGNFNSKSHICYPQFH
jgi:hypothetical protein